MKFSEDQRLARAHLLYIASLRARALSDITRIKESRVILTPTRQLGQ